MRECAEHLGIPRTTLMENVATGRFLLTHQVRKVERTLGRYSQEAGFDGRQIVAFFIEAYSFEAKLRDCLADPAAFDSAARCAVDALKAYLPGRWQKFSGEQARMLLETALESWGRPATEELGSMLASYVLWRVRTRLGDEDWIERLDGAVAYGQQAAAYDALISLVRSLRIEFDPASASARVLCDTVRGETLSCGMRFDAFDRGRYGFRAIPREEYLDRRSRPRR